MAKLAKISIDHFCIDDILDMYAERDIKRRKKLEKKNKEKKTDIIVNGKLEINIEM